MAKSSATKMPVPEGWGEKAPKAIKTVSVKVGKAAAKDKLRNAPQTKGNIDMNPEPAQSIEVLAPETAAPAVTPTVPTVSYDEMVASGLLALAIARGETLSPNSKISAPRLRAMNEAMDLRGVPHPEPVNALTPELIGAYAQRGYHVVGMTNASYMGDYFSSVTTTLANQSSPMIRGSRYEYETMHGMPVCFVQLVQDGDRWYYQVCTDAAKIRVALYRLYGTGGSYSYTGLTLDKSPFAPGLRLGNDDVPEAVLTHGIEAAPFNTAPDAFYTKLGVVARYDVDAQEWLGFFDVAFVGDEPKAKTGLVKAAYKAAPKKVKVPRFGEAVRHRVVPSQIIIDTNKLWRMPGTTGWLKHQASKTPVNPSTSAIKEAIRCIVRPLRELFDYKPGVEAANVILNRVGFTSKAQDDDTLDSEAVANKMMRDKEGNLSGVLYQGTSRVTAASSGVLTDLSHFDSIKQGVTTDFYAKLWGRKFLDKINVRREELHTSINRLNAKMLSESKELGDQNFLARTFETSGATGIAAVIDRIKALPGFESVEMTIDGIRLTTEELYYTPEPDGNYNHYEPRFLGKVVFYIDPIKGGISYQNLMLAKTTGPISTTATVSNGDVCLGSYPTLLSMALQSFDYDQLALLLLEFVRDPQLHDGRGQNNYVSHFPKTKPKRVYASRVAKLFGGGAAVMDDASDGDEDFDDDDD